MFGTVKVVSEADFEAQAGEDATEADSEDEGGDE